MKKIITTVLLIVSILLTNGQEKTEASRLKLELKDNKTIKNVYVDGKKFDFPLELIDENVIESVIVLKKPQMIIEYNLSNNTSYESMNSLLLITTKKKEKKTKIGESDDSVNREQIQPKIIIDGKKSNKATLDKLQPEQIKSITVLKGESAKNFNAPNGVILVTTKKN